MLQILVIALGAGLGVWGVINLLEGYGNDNPGANAHVHKETHKGMIDSSLLFRKFVSGFLFQCLCYNISIPSKELKICGKDS